LSEFWDGWQLNLLDDYILGYAPFDTQEELADEIGKTLNAVKIKLSRRRMQIEEEKRQLTIEEYKLILSNRFDKTTEEVASILNTSRAFLLNEMDELDSLECKEFFEENYKSRIASVDEMRIFIRLYKKKRNSFQIAHILNRPIEKIQEMINNYETCFSNN
jgi:hypothetical protein